MELNERVVKVEESIKSAHHRIDTLEKEIDNINNLTISVHEIATEMKAMREDVSNMNIRIKQIEDKPSKRYDSIVDKVIMTIIGAIVGYILVKLGL